MENKPWNPFQSQESVRRRTGVRKRHQVQAPFSLTRTCRSLPGSPALRVTTRKRPLPIPGSSIRCRQESSLADSAAETRPVRRMRRLAPRCITTQPSAKWSGSTTPRTCRRPYPPGGSGHGPRVGGEEAVLDLTKTQAINKLLIWKAMRKLRLLGLSIQRT